jgi:hypothetical protein
LFRILLGIDTTSSDPGANRVPAAIVARVPPSVSSSIFQPSIATGVSPAL